MIKLQLFFAKHRYDLVHLQAHTVIYLIVAQSDMIFVNRIPADQIRVSHPWRSIFDRRYSPFLQLDLRPVRTRLRGNELLQVAHRVVGAALHSNW